MLGRVELGARTLISWETPKPWKTGKGPQVSRMLFLRVSVCLYKVTGLNGIKS